MLGCTSKPSVDANLAARTIRSLSSVNLTIGSPTHTMSRCRMSPAAESGSTKQSSRDHRPRRSWKSRLARSSRMSAQLT